MTIMHQINAVTQCDAHEVVRVMGRFGCRVADINAAHRVVMFARQFVRDVYEAPRLKCIILQCDDADIMIGAKCLRVYPHIASS